MSTSQPSTRVEYRLTFETINAIWAAVFDARGGKYEHLWNEGDWDMMPWLPPVTRITGNVDVIGQYHQLKRWAESHEQPIRGVRLEERTVLVDDGEGWEPFSGSA